MLFFPYRAELNLYRLPIVTLLVCLLCLVIFLMQQQNQGKLENALDHVCGQQNRELRQILRAQGLTPTAESCKRVLYTIYHSGNTEESIEKLAVRSVQLGWAQGIRDNMLYRQELMKRQISDYYAQFSRVAPRTHLTPELWYVPGSWNSLKMITAALAHASWSHLLGNLFFFYVFAATVEIILGAWRYVLALILIAITGFTVYSLTSSGSPVPTLGLSGVVMGVMALFAYFLPWVQIRCFFWFFFIFRTFTLPAWLLVVWFVGQDAYHLFSKGDNGGVNLVAHVSGAIAGFGLGFLLFRKQKGLVGKILKSS